MLLNMLSKKDGYIVYPPFSTYVQYTHVNKYQI